MHAFFQIRTVIIPQPISITHSLVCVCVCVCEANIVLFNSMLKYMINRLMHAWSISVSQDDNRPGMEKGMHAIIIIILIYL